MRQLSISIALMLGFQLGLRAQTISTTYSNAPENFLGGISFKIANTNSDAIRITSIESVHSTNDPTQNATCRIWYKTSNVTRNIGPISAANGWILHKTQIKTGLSSTRQPFLTNLAIDIPSGQTYTLFLESDKTSSTLFIPPGTSDTFSAAGVYLFSGDSHTFSGTLAMPVATPRGFVGNVNFQFLSPCSGLPSAGNIEFEQGFCAGETKVYSLTNYTFGSGITFQWFSSPNNTVFSPIFGATNANYSAPQNADIFYRVEVRCTNTNPVGVSTSPSIKDTLRPPVYCTCPTTPNISTADEDDIVRVSLNANTRSANCGSIPTPAGPATIAGVYTDWRPTGVLANLKQGSKNALELDVDYCGSTATSNRSVNVFIDLNGNRTLESNEIVYSSGNITNASQFLTLTPNIFIPSNAGGGLLSPTNRVLPVLMRVVLLRAPSSVSNPCVINGTFGEVEDFWVNLEYTENCTGTPQGGQVVGTTEFCPGEVSKFITINSTIAPNVTRAWDTASSPLGPWGAVVGAAGDTLNISLNKSTYIRSRITCLASGQTAISAVHFDSLKPSVLCLCIPAIPPNLSLLDGYLEDFSIFGHYGTSIEQQNTGISVSPYRYADYRFSSTRTLKINPLEPFNCSFLASSFPTATTNSHAYIYIDTNMNGLQASDRVYTTFGSTLRISNDPSNPTLTPSITLNSSKLGITAMRVFYRNSITQQLDPCDGITPPSLSATNLGEIHDYMIEIYKPEVDFKLLIVTNPESGCSRGIVPVTFEIQNIGKNTLAPIVNYSVNGGPTISQTFPSLTSGEISTFSFDTLLDLNKYTGKVTIRVWSSNPGDENLSNNSLERIIYHYITPPDPKVKGDTACGARNYVVFQSNIPPGYQTVWYQDSLGTIFDTVATNVYRFNPPIGSDTLYAQSVYFSDTMAGSALPSVPRTSFVQNLGLRFRIKKNIIKIKSVDVYTNAELDTLTISIFKNSSGVNLIRTYTYIATYAGQHTIPLEHYLTGNINDEFRIILTKHKGATIDSFNSTLLLNNFLATLPNNYLEIVSSATNTSSLTTPARYPFFYNFQIDYPACQSALKPAYTLVDTFHKNPTGDLPSKIDTCTFPQVELKVLDSVNMKYLWSNGDTTRTIKPKVSGRYIVTITDSTNGCTNYDTTDLNLRQSPIFSLGKDTSSCASNGIRLKTGFTNAGYNHRWTPYSLDPWFDIKESGTYMVEVKNTGNNCFYRDTIRVKIHSFTMQVITDPTQPLQKINGLGEDKVICKGDTIIRIIDTMAHRSFLWNTGSTSKNETFRATSKIWVRVTDTVTKGIDTFRQPITNKIDTVIHYNDTVVNKTDTAYIRINRPKIIDSFYTEFDTFYTLALDTFNLHCVLTDTMELRVIDLKKPELRDTIICDKHFHTIVVPSDTSYRNAIYNWNSGSKSSQNTVSRSGEYIVSITENGTSCTVADTMQLNFYTTPTLTLGPDRVVCDISDTLTALVSEEFNRYVWTGGGIPIVGNDKKRLISTSGTYYVEGFHQCDTIKVGVSVSFQKLPNPITLPNDTSICDSLTLSIAAQNPGTRIRWSTGDTTPTITVNESKVVSVSVSTDCGVFTDAMSIVKIDTPVANFNITTANLFGIFTNLSTNAVRYNWNYGNGKTDTVRIGTSQYDSFGKYTVTLTVTNKCGVQASKTDTVRFFRSGIVNNSLQAIAVYPNPATNELTIEIEEFSRPIALEIYSMQGVKVFENALDHKKSTLDISTLANGVYWLKITDGQDIHRTKIEIRR